MAHPPFPHPMMMPHPGGVSVCVTVCVTEWIITVGHRTFAEQNQLMTEQKHRCSDIVADRSIDAARGAVLASWLTAGLWLPY